MVSRRLHILEILMLSLLVVLLYTLPLINRALPVFAGQFNTLDGSLYVRRGFDTILTLVMVWVTTRYLIPKRLARRDLLTLVGCGLGLLVGVSLLELGLDRLTLWAYNLPLNANAVSDKMLLYPVRETVSNRILPWNALAIALSLLYGLSREQLILLRGQQERLATEIKYLKSQINPHFLFNTLNNIYAITQRPGSGDTSEALLRLSELLRYTLYDSEAEQVSAEAEWRHIKAYVDLMRLKYAADDPLEIGLESAGDLEHQTLAPLLLIPLVENAFKHGIDSQGQGSIHIRLDAGGQGLRFEVRNTIPARSRKTESIEGLGLANVRRRLDLLYPGRHHLDIKRSSDSYRVVLRLGEGRR